MVFIVFLSLLQNLRNSNPLILNKPLSYNKIENKEIKSLIYVYNYDTIVNINVK